MRARLPALVAIVALVMLAAVVARGTSAVPIGQGRPLLGFLDLRLDLPGWSGGEVTAGLPAPGGWSGAVALVILLTPLALLVLAIIVAVVLALIAAWRRGIAVPSVVPGEDGPPDAEGHAARLVRAARDARVIVERHRGGPASDAVVAAWVRLEEAAADIGTARLAHQTPTEFAEAVRARHDPIAAPLERLRELYLRARFGMPGRVGPVEEAAARAALDEIVHGLTRKPASR